MFTINIKGKENPKDLKMVKLEMIIFKTGYARVTKVLNVSGPVKDWDNQAQAFKGNGSTLTAKNKILFELKNQYQKVAEEWDYENRAWSPVELSHCLDEVQTRKDEVKSLSLTQMIDSLIDKFTKKERYKNGQIVTSANNARSYKELKTSLSRFTQEEYNRGLSTYFSKRSMSIFCSITHSTYKSWALRTVIKADLHKNSVVCVPLADTQKSKVSMEWI